MFVRLSVGFIVFCWLSIGVIDRVVYSDHNCPPTQNCCPAHYCDYDDKNPPVIGPDVIVGVLPDMRQQSSSGAQWREGSWVGLGLATTSCNKGDVTLVWCQMAHTDHPVIAQNLYRLKDDRFEQIGQSWVKHAFAALQGNACGFGCTSSGTATRLGVGCSDPYSSSLNGSQSTLGSRAWINPFTGDFPSTARNHSGHAHGNTSHRILVHDDFLDQNLNADALYFAEGQYVSPHEHISRNCIQNNVYNNVSYRQFEVTGVAGGEYFFPVPEDENGDDIETVREEPAINAWTGSTQVTIEPDPGNDGIAILAYKVTPPEPGGGVWHYEYLLYNMNLDRSIREFVVPVTKKAQITNVGFHAPPQHPGVPNDGTFNDEGYSDVPWDSSISQSEVRWATETIGENPNANAIRWGTAYNFRFDSTRPPIQATAEVWMFKTCEMVEVSILAPDADCNNNGVGDSFDISSGTSDDDDRNGIPDDCLTACPADIDPPGGNGVVDVDDLGEIFIRWGACPTVCQSTCSADIAPLGSGNGSVDTDDMGEVFINWGDCP